jgi:catechol 2,3-dioxygenase-like lactoylglutathione lyase family enzyme
LPAALPLPQPIAALKPQNHPQIPPTRLKKGQATNDRGLPHTLSGVVLLALLCTALAAPAELPDFYKSVDRVFWVVDDIDRTIAGWQRLGIIEIGASPNAGERVRWTVARLGNAIVDFIQPLDDKSVFAQYRKKHGQGVMALVHRCPTKTAMEQEVARLTKAGIAILASRNLGEEGRYALFDTGEEGKYVLGLICCSERAQGGLPGAPEARPNAKKVSQYAFVARDLEKVSKYWARLGFPEMSFTHPALWDLRYHAQPGQFDAILGWQRHGNVVYEWIQPTTGPTTYMDHMARHGEGLHHIAFGVQDIEQEKSVWSKAGFPTSQSGAWGERDQAGYGRFAYQDMHTIGGVEIELLWNYRK